MDIREKLTAELKDAKLGKYETAVKNAVESDKAAITYNVTTGNVGTTVTPTTTQALVEGRELLNQDVAEDEAKEEGKENVE